MFSSALPTIEPHAASEWPAPTAAWQHAGHSGQFHVQVDLIRGVGRRDAIPNVALTYQTGGPNSVFGPGWSLNIPSFFRGGERQLPRFRDSGPDADKYFSTEFGELVPVPARAGENRQAEPRSADGFDVVRFRPRVDSSFVRVERRADPATGETHWLTISRDNVTRVYGRTRGARVADPANSRRVARWLLEEERDSRGNLINFEYKREDLAGVTAGTLPERHRLAARLPEALLHPKRVRWGNGRPHEPGGWLFELVFDYGEHDADSPAEGPAWALRPDAFSDYRNGFELRTRRLCRRALLFQHLPAPGAASPLVRAHEFSYDTTPAASLLVGVRLRGYRRERDEEVVSRSLPAVSFSYAAASPPGPVREVVFSDGQTAGGAAATLQWHDLGGSGLPGLVSRAPGGALHYRKNLGDGVIGSPEVLASRPSLTDSTLPAAQSLGKPFGDGRSCLIDLGEGPGYQERKRAGAWMPFTPFRHAPSVLSGTAGALDLDLDGDGRADFMTAGEFGPRWHKFNGRDGWSPAREAANPQSARAALADRTGTVLHADMTGDGLADLVQVLPGSVRYWPNLGYGRFGEPVQMADSPLLDGPGLFDPARVRLADVDGTGTADLVYLGRAAVTCYPNRCGNSFGAGRPFANLPAVTDLDAVDVVDLLGTGTGCLVWSSASPGRADRPVRYTELVGGRRPHLLTSIRNGQGLEVEVSYSTSTRLMLDDRKAGRPWHTTQPFPSWHVTEARETDFVSGVAQVTSWSYRHAYYDEAQRESRGFAFVEKRETQIVPPDPGGTSFGEPVVGRVTRTWYHTGAHAERTRLEDALVAEFYAGGGRPARPGLSVVNECGVSPRELLRALQGRPMREEIYGSLDGATDAHPYATVDYGYLLRALQPPTAAEHPSVSAFLRETLERTYEREPDDPRVSHRLVLEIDPLGNTTRQANVAYARQRAEEVEQGRTLLTLEEQDFFNHDEEPDWYRAGVPVGTRVFEVGPPPTPADGGLLRVEDFAGLTAAADEDDLRFDERLPATGAPRRRLIGATKTRYWDDTLKGAAREGTAGRLALVYEQRRAAFTDGLLSAVYEDGAVGREDLESSGYEYEGGLWWACGPRVTYSREVFYQPLTQRTALGAESSVAYDAHALFVAQSRDPVGNVLSARHDYQAMAPAVVTDPNGATVTTAFDALRLPTAVVVAGARGEGDSPESPTHEFSRDMLAWERDGTPVALRVSSLSLHGDPSGLREQTVSFLDGRGRELQSKRKAEPEGGPDAERWVVEKHLVLSAGGRAVRSYAPGFTPGGGFSPEPALASFPVTRWRLDALGRPVQTRHANGTLTRTALAAWHVAHWDANDAVRDSDWLRFRRRDGATPREAAEADAAEEHVESPSAEYLDPAGRPFLEVQDGKAAGFAETRAALTVGGQAASVTDARGVLAEERMHDMLGRPLLTRSAASGTARVFYDAEGEPVRVWGARGQEQRLKRDRAGRPVLREVRPRGGDWRVAELLVWGEDAPEGGDYLRGRLYLYFDGAGRLKTPGYDFRGRPLRAERLFRRDMTLAADWTPLLSHRRAAQVEQASLALLAEEQPLVVSGTYDAQGRPVTRATPDGSITSVEYNRRGLPSSILVTAADGRRTEVLREAVYDAAGRRLSARLGNGVVELSAYDERSGLLTGRATAGPGGGLLRDLSFSHDAAGNVLAVADAAQPPRYFRNAAVSADRSFRYDALYRLVEAHGREAAVPTPPERRGRVPPLYNLPHDKDLTAVRPYAEHYAYDLAGNMTRREHVAEPAGSWTIQYDIDSAADRITGLRRGDGRPISGRFVYDDAGNAEVLGRRGALVWDEDEQLVRVELEGGGTAFYAYDATGRRAAKVVVRRGGLREERFYFEGYEYYRRVDAGGDVRREESVLHVQEGEGRLLIVERRRVADDPAWSTLWRYQHADQVGSSWLETGGDGRVLTCEEFRPYGTTAYHAARPETPPKRYRFGGQESDAETGFNYHGARYYAPWLSRWLSPDPAGMADGMNRYAYVSSNPTSFSDPSGLQRLGQSRIVYPAPNHPPVVQRYVGGGQWMDTPNQVVSGVGVSIALPPDEPDAPPQSQPAQPRPASRRQTHRPAPRRSRAHPPASAPPATPTPAPAPATSTAETVAPTPQPTPSPPATTAPAAPASPPSGGSRVVPPTVTDRIESGLLVIGGFLERATELSEVMAAVPYVGGPFAAWAGAVRFAQAVTGSNFQGQQLTGDERYSAAISAGYNAVNALTVAAGSMLPRGSGGGAAPAMSLAATGRAGVTTVAAPVGVSWVARLGQLGTDAVITLGPPAFGAAALLSSSTNPLNPSGTGSAAEPAPATAESAPNSAPAIEPPPGVVAVWGRAEAEAAMREYSRVRHLPGAERWLDDLASGSANTAFGARGEMRVAARLIEHGSEVELVNDRINNFRAADILARGSSGASYVIDVKTYDFSTRYHRNHFLQPIIRRDFVNQAVQEWTGPTPRPAHMGSLFDRYQRARRVVYIFDGITTEGIPLAVRQQLENAGVIVRGSLSNLLLP